MLYEQITHTQPIALGKCGIIIVVVVIVAAAKLLWPHSMCYFILAGRVCVVVVGAAAVGAAGDVEPVASSHTNISSDCDKNADTHMLWQINQRISERKKKITQSFSRTQCGMGFGSV